MQLILFSLVPHPQRGQSSASATRPHWWNLPGELNQAEYLLTRGLEAVPQTWSWHVLASFPLVSPLCPVLLWTLRERERSSFLSRCDNSICSASSRMNYGWTRQPLNAVEIYFWSSSRSLYNSVRRDLRAENEPSAGSLSFRFENLNLYFILFFFLNGEDTRKTIPQHRVILH